jgi:hypothetical protein
MMTRTGDVSNGVGVGEGMICGSATPGVRALKPGRNRCVFGLPAKGVEYSERHSESKRCIMLNM